MVQVTFQSFPYSPKSWILVLRRTLLHMSPTEWDSMSMVHLNSDRLDSGVMLRCSLLFLSLSFLIWNYSASGGNAPNSTIIPSCSLPLFYLPPSLFFYFQYMLNHSFSFWIILWAFKSIKKFILKWNRFLWAFKCIQIKSHLKIKTETKTNFPDPYYPATIFFCLFHYDKIS